MDASAAAKTTDAKPTEPTKSAATGSSAVEPEAAKPDASTGPAKPGVSRVGATDALTDGPILDLKAKSVADAAAAKPGEKASGKPAEPPTARPTSSQASYQGPGYAAVAVAAVIGGILGAILVYALARTGSIGAKSEDGRIAALEQTVANLPPRDALAALETRIEANQHAADAASDLANNALKKAGAAGGPSNAELAAKLDALDLRVSALQEEPGRELPADSKATVLDGGGAERLADFEERLKAIETRGEASPVSTPSAAPSPEIAQKLAGLQGEIDARAKTAESATVVLAQRLDQLQQSVDARVKSATEAIQTSAEASRQLADATRTQAAEAAKAAERRIQEQADRVAALDKAVEGTAKAATVHKALQIVAADRILTALANGTPYADALTSLRNSDPGGAERYEALAPFAETGAPTAAALAQTFRPIGEKIAAARRAAKTKTVAETGSFTDRLQSMASSLVQVKKTGEPAAAPGAASDDDPTAAVLEALDRGRIADAAKAFAALPEDVRAQTGDFGAKLKARADAQVAALALQADGFKGLAAAPAAN